MIELRAYQRDAIEALLRWFDTETGDPLVSIPTGGGKSVIQAAFIKQAFEIDPHARVLCVTHVKELIAQNWMRLLQLWPQAPCGVYSAGLNRRDLHTPILFAGIQSIFRMGAKIEPFDLIIVDECHLLPAKGEGMYRGFFADARRVNPYLKIIGMTATPYRLDAGPLVEAGLFGGVAYDLPLQRLISEGALVEVVSRGSLHRANLSGVHTRQGEFVEAEAAERMMAVTQTAIAEAGILAAERVAWLVFCVTVRHAEQTARILREAGIACAVITGQTPNLERDRLIRDYQAGRVRALVNVGVLTTGFDAPRTDCIVCLRPTLSAGLWVQICGRGMRPAPGKANCLVLDYAGNIARHGPLDQIRGRSKRPGEAGGEAPQRQCPQCQALCHASLAVCPECGHVFPPPQPKIEINASALSILSHQKQVSVLDVEHVYYAAHLARSGIPVMRVIYHCGMLTRVSEFVCLEHAGYARAKAEAWWRRRGGALVPDSVEDAVFEAEALAKPARIRVAFGGKYPELLSAEFA